MYLYPHASKSPYRAGWTTIHYCARHTHDVKGDGKAELRAAHQSGCSSCAAEKAKNTTTQQEPTQ